MPTSSPRRLPSSPARRRATHYLVAGALLSGAAFTFALGSPTGGKAPRPVPQSAPAETFNQNALDTLVGNLRQEIVQGSTATAVNGGSTVYTPTTNANMVPVRSGNPAPAGTTPATDPIPNLIRRSVRADAIPAPGVPSLASAVNSAADPALNGGAVSPARWNAHYLIPRQNTGTAVDSTPVADFTAPDWVMVTNDGPKVLTAPDPTVTGRYAFAMYDEGGLLDVNVAGYPTGTPLAAYKRSLPFADLTKLPFPLSQTQVDNLVGWRNYATARPGGSFGNYTFDAASAQRYYESVASNTNGFLAPSAAPPFNGQSDQVFTSRQALLQYRRDAGLSQNALQYLTTFSRALEQPSFIPAHIQYPTTAPSINTVAATAPPPASWVDSYLGNNDAAGSAGSGVAGQDLINPVILTVRVKSAFTRQDGSTAVVGEPLVKRRFALSRLAEVAFNATDATPSVTDPALTGGNHVKDWFGLSRTSTSAPWTYNHGSANKIKTLAEVAALNPGREPDFAELLKASINVGSLAKGGPNLHNDQGNYQYTLDVSVDYQVLQIMANLIDQADADSFPTVIQIAVVNAFRTVRGTEDLPYFYRYHPMSVVTRLPSPLLAKTDKVDWRNRGQTTSSSPFRTTLNCAPGTLSDGGEAVLLYAPDVWNPHDAGAATGNPAGPRPARFRLVAVTQDPAGKTPLWNAGALARVNGGYYDDIPMKASIPSALGPLATEAATAFTFGDDGGRLFREPTLLWRADAPLNSNLQADAGSLAGPYTDANTGVQYFGAQVGKTPVSYVSAVDTSRYYGTPASPNGNYIFQASFLYPNQQVPPGAYVQYTFRLQYQDPNGSGAWITYDEKYPDIHGLYEPNLVVNKADFPGSKWKNPFVSGQTTPGATGYDPRTARFGIGVNDQLDRAGSPLLEPGAAANYNSTSDAGNQAFVDSLATMVVTQRPYRDRGNQPNYSMPGMTSDPGKNAQMRWFSGIGYSATNVQNTSPLFYDGLLAQNDPQLNILARNNSTFSQLYYEDADGVPRRAAGAYVLKDPSTGTLPTAGTADAYANLEGQPLATANTYAAGSYGVGTPTAQNQSRPLVLNRPFRSVAEMSYAFRGTPWKQLDFFTPESGDAFLLDTFCLNEPPAGGMVAGKVNLNTRQAPVLQAILTGAYRDEQAGYPTQPNYGALGALSAAEAANVAAKLVTITTADTTATPWRGPLINVGNLVGRFVPNAGNPGAATDQYTFTETVTNKSYTYAGLSAALDNSVYTASNATAARVQRMREAAIRPLADVGQTRVWNILVDLVTQTGGFPVEATTLGQFAVAEENHYWLHVAIDRFTGQVIDQSVEQVFEGVTGLALSATAVPENQPAGTVVGTIQPTDANPNDIVTYSLVSGTGDADNAAFTVSGNTLQTAGTFQYLSRVSYQVRLRAANALGQGFERAFTITVLPGAYTQWKVANFGGAANDPTVAGDAADPDQDGLANVVEYALGTSPTRGNASGINTAIRNGLLTLTYPRASTATDVTVQTFRSPDLANPGAWTRTGVTETMLSDDGQVQRWQATTPVSGTPAGFLQLRVTRP